jgi:hypothetical protein
MKWGNKGKMLNFKNFFPATLHFLIFIKLYNVADFARTVYPDGLDLC